MANKKERAIYCWNCARRTTHTYEGRDRKEFASKVALGIISLGIFPLLDAAMGDGIGGLTYWKCTRCGDINDD